MRSLQTLALVAAALTGVGGVALAQTAISTKAGLINVADGDVYLDEQQVRMKVTEFISVGQGQTLRTEEGRAEVLLTPGAFLRMPDSTAFRLEKASMMDVRIEVLRGGVLVEVAEVLPDNLITVSVGDASALLRKVGLYRIDADPEPRIRVYEGEAAVRAGGRDTVLKGSRELMASADGWSAAKFDSKDTDALYRWSKRRSEYVAMANLSAARTTTGYRSGFGQMSGWVWNPWFGTMTFVPFGNTLYSPFGFAYFSPYTVYRAYQPRPVYSNPGGGGGGAAQGPGFGRGSYFPASDGGSRSVSAGSSGVSAGGGRAGMESSAGSGRGSDAGPRTGGGGPRQ